jgi:hypothetical protein
MQDDMKEINDEIDNGAELDDEYQDKFDELNSLY